MLWWERSVNSNPVWWPERIRCEKGTVPAQGLSGLCRELIRQELDRHTMAGHIVESAANWGFGRGSPGGKLVPGPIRDISQR